MNKCTNCQTENQDSLSFCTRCGKRLPPSLRGFFEQHSLQDRYESFVERGVTSISDLLLADLESFRSFVPYGDIVRLRKALQSVGSANLMTGSVASQPTAIAFSSQTSEPSTPAPIPPVTSPPIQQPAQPHVPVVSSDSEWPKKAARNYTIMLWSIVSFGLAGLVGALLANFQFKKIGADDDLIKGHLRWQTRTFSLSFIWGIVLSICGFLIFPDSKDQGNFLPFLAWVWFYYRVVKGRSLLKASRPAYTSDPSGKNVLIGIVCAAAIAVAAIIRGSVSTKPETTNVDSVVSESTAPAPEDDSRLADIERQREEAERRARQAEEEAQRLRQTAEQAQREKEEALERAREFETAATKQLATNASYGSTVLSFSDAKSRADDGDAYAQAVVSIYYATGYKAPKDVVMAAQYAIRSAEQGHPLGIYRLGAMRQAGDAMAPDEQQGLQLKERAFSGLDRMVGDPYAMTAVGIMLFRGENVAKDKTTAANLYKRAADMGYAPAQFTYSACLLSGQGVPKSEGLGLEYWQKAYAQSYPPALEGPPR